jgi:hypothetical protein
MSAVLDPATDTPPRARSGPRAGVVFLRWLRKIHLYVGLWGAALGFLFGATGILLNHRAVLKIPVERAVQRTTQLALPEGASPQSPEQLAAWLQGELQMKAQSVRARAEPPKTVRWADREIEQPPRWTVNLQSPQRAVNVEYLPGNRYLKLETQDATPLGTLMRLHTATGAGAFWVLLADTIAGGFMLLSVTGLLLWSRLRTIKLTAVAVSLAALCGAVWFVWSSA